MNSKGLALVILAAGASRRLGTCKALVSLGSGPGENALGKLLAAGSSSSAAAPLLITGFHDRMLRAAAPAGVEVLFNPDWEAGRTGGVALAAKARANFDLLLAPVDVPRVPRSVFESLLQSWNQAGQPAQGWLAPYCEDLRGKTVPQGEPSSKAPQRYGHPIVLGRALASSMTKTRAPEYFSAGELDDLRSVPLRKWRELALPLLGVEVSSHEILENLDTQADLQRMRNEFSP